MPIILMLLYPCLPLLQDFLQNSELISRIASALLKGEFYERGGNLYEKIRDYQKAMECYRRGKAYRQGKIALK